MNAEPARFRGLAVGDRVTFQGFGAPDPDPGSLPVGTAGTVEGWDEGSGQLRVDWDNGSGLMPIIAPSRFAPPGERPRLDRVRRIRPE